MRNHRRSLTTGEIERLEASGCSAEDWTNVEVSEEFDTTCVRNVSFYGQVSIGAFDKKIEIGNGFLRKPGIKNVTIANVSMGDNCLIENVGLMIGYDIGDECCICNVGKIISENDACFGQGSVISVMNEAGKGNIVMYPHLTCQMTALMIRCSYNREAFLRLKKMVERHIKKTQYKRAQIGDRVKITDTKEIINAIFENECEVNGASRLCDVTFVTTKEVGVCIGSGVILENVIVQAGTTITSNACLHNCFVGEACMITQGFSAENSVFFDNSYLSNGEACAALCGPFTTSCHKSTLLIGVKLSFFNAGSATNFSNHAYKMGPIHYGIFSRGCKTASGTHILLPAKIGAFSTVIGKISTHPDTSKMPFSYVIGEETTTHLIPGRAIITAGLWRDTNKWKHRDMRPRDGRKSKINMEWLNPVTIEQVYCGLKELQRIEKENEKQTQEYQYQGCIINKRALEKGKIFYKFAIKLYIGQALEEHPYLLPTTTIGTKGWIDMLTMPVPEIEIEYLINEILGNEITEIEDVERKFNEINGAYEEYKWCNIHRLMSDVYETDALNENDISRIKEDCKKIKRQWKEAIRRDAEKEYELGDVEKEVLDNFIDKLYDQERKEIIK